MTIREEQGATEVRGEAFSESTSGQLLGSGAASVGIAQPQ